jgi:hypothetical protein
VTPLADISQVLPIEEPAGAPPRRALGWYQGSEGLVFSLLSLETSPPSLLDRTEVDYDALDGRAAFSIDGARGFFRAHQAGGALVMGAIDWSGDVLNVQVPLLEGPTAPGFEIGGYSYVVGDSVRVAAFGDDVEAVIELGKDGVIDVASSPGGEARLLVSADQTTRRVELERAGVIESIPLSSRAVRVLPAGDRWLVLESGQDAACSLPGPACEPSFVTVIGDTPARVIGRVDLPNAAVPPLGSGSNVLQQWLSSDEYGVGPIAISENRWVLVRDVNATCNSQADCAALGISASPAAAAGVTVATPQPCAPEVPGMNVVCEEPVESPALSGSGTRRAFFVFDPAAATLSAPVFIDTRGDSYFALGVPVALAAPNETLLSLRIERLPLQPGSPRRGRFLLDRIEVNAAGELVNTGTHVVPGYPVGLLDADTLVSVQPSSDPPGAAKLVRSDFASRGVELGATRGLEPRFGDVVLANGHAVYLRRATDACLGQTALESFQLDGDLTPTGSLDLTGSGDIVGAYGSDVIVADRSQRFTRVHVADDGSLSLAAEASASAPMDEVEWRDGVLFGVAFGQVVRLPL